MPVAALAAPALGIAQSAIDFVTALGKKKPNDSTQTMGERPVAQSQIAEATAMLGTARAYFYQSLNEAYALAQAGNLIDQDHKIKVQLATTYAIRTAADAVDLVCRAAGTTAIRETSQLEKHFRDITGHHQTRLCLHGTLRVRRQVAVR